MKKILLIIIALTTVFGAFTFLARDKTNPTVQQPSSTNSQETAKPVVTQPNNPITTITLTDTGFTPKDVTVKTGTRMVWLNKSGETATVNSDDHPTHQLYPFLNLGEFAADSSVQVVVNEAGKYSYHNHYNASQGGTVTVE